MIASAGLARLAVSGLLLQAAVHVPAADIPTLCKTAAVFGTGEKSYRICIRDETEARDRLRALWPTLTTADREICLGNAELGVAKSYVDIVGCIAMNHELDREKRLPANRRLPPQ